MDEEPGITKPAYAFTINSPDYLRDAESFSKLNIVSKDSMAYKYYALRIFQQLISFHLNDNNKNALIDVDLKRLQFVYQHLVLSNKQDLYLDALQSLEQKIIQSPVSTLITFNIAGVWVEKGRLYKPLQSDDHKWELKKAYGICETAIQRFPNSAGAAMSYNLQRELLNKIISAELEKVNVPDIPFRALVHYCNFNNLYWRIVRVTREEVKDQRIKWNNDYNVDREEKFLEYFRAKSPVISGKVRLPNDSDYQEHSVEIKLDGVSEGDYMVLFSPDPGFTISGNNLAYAFTTISNLSYIHRNLDNGNTEFYILNRTTGRAIPGAKLQTSFNVYNSKSGQYVIVKGDVYTSAEDGSIQIPMTKESGNYYENYIIADISWQNDKISTRDIDYSGNGYSYGASISQYMRGKPSRTEQTLFFLDRAIYRPGQTLYFKGLIYSTDGKDPQIVTNRRVTVTFYDVNNQVVADK
jgi:hypothetical protein